MHHINIQNKHNFIKEKGPKLQPSHSMIKKKKLIDSEQQSLIIDDKDKENFCLQFSDDEQDSLHYNYSATPAFISPNKQTKLIINSSKKKVPSYTNTNQIQLQLSSQVCDNPNNLLDNNNIIRSDNDDFNFKIDKDYNISFIQQENQTLNPQNEFLNDGSNKNKTLNQLLSKNDKFLLNFFRVDSEEKQPSQSESFSININHKNNSQIYNIEQLKLKQNQNSQTEFEQIEKYHNQQYMNQKLKISEILEQITLKQKSLNSFNIQNNSSFKTQFLNNSSNKNNNSNNNNNYINPPLQQNQTTNLSTSQFQQQQQQLQQQQQQQQSNRSAKNYLFIDLQSLKQNNQISSNASDSQNYQLESSDQNKDDSDTCPSSQQAKTMKQESAQQEQESSIPSHSIQRNVSDISENLQTYMIKSFLYNNEKNINNQEFQKYFQTEISQEQQTNEENIISCYNLQQDQYYEEEHEKNQKCNTSHDLTSITSPSNVKQLKLKGLINRSNSCQKTVQNTKISEENNSICQESANKNCIQISRFFSPKYQQTAKNSFVQPNKQQEQQSFIKKRVNIKKKEFSTYRNNLNNHNNSFYSTNQSKTNCSQTNKTQMSTSKSNSQNSEQQQYLQQQEQDFQQNSQQKLQDFQKESFKKKRQIRQEKENQIQLMKNRINKLQREEDQLSKKLNFIQKKREYHLKVKSIHDSQQNILKEIKEKQTNEKNEIQKNVIDSRTKMNKALRQSITNVQITKKLKANEIKELSQKLTNQKFNNILQEQQKIQDSKLKIISSQENLKQKKIQKQILTISKSKQSFFQKIEEENYVTNQLDDELKHLEDQEQFLIEKLKLTLEKQNQMINSKQNNQND